MSVNEMQEAPMRKPKPFQTEVDAIRIRVAAAHGHFLAMETDPAVLPPKEVRG